MRDDLDKGRLTGSAPKRDTSGPGRNLSSSIELYWEIPPGSTSSLFPLRAEPYHVLRKWGGAPPVFRVSALVVVNLRGGQFVE